jgi:hypothetical protein
MKINLIKEELPKGLKLLIKLSRIFVAPFVSSNKKDLGASRRYLFY